MKLKLLVLISSLFILVSCSSEGGQNDPGAVNETVEEVKENPNHTTSGGTLNIAFPTEPVTLDPQVSSNTAVKDATRSIYEQIVAIDQEGQVIYDLAEEIELSEDQLTYTIKLREGVMFHNGEELVAADAVASLERWIELSALGQTNFADATLQEVDTYTFEFELQNPNLLTLELLADPVPAAAILPKDIIDDASPNGANEFIGTGPYKVGDWQQNQYLVLERFEDYSSEGRLFEKAANVDDIHINFVSDELTRLTGVTTGEYDIALNISNDNLEQLENTQDVESQIEPGGFLAMFYNHESPIFKDVKARQAINALMPVDDILSSAYANESLYQVTSSIVTDQYENFYSEAGDDQYNQNNSELAQSLLEESSYNGETLKLVTTRDYVDQYNMSVVLQQALESIDVNVELEVYDWPTLQDIKKDPDKWDLSPLTFAERPTYLQSFWRTDGMPIDSEINELLTAVTSADSLEDARPAIDDVQQYVWDEASFSLVGHRFGITAVADHVEGYEFILGPIFYNVNLDEE
ncbi:ABC transporter substrate-binding protein [Bacillaceae bacterium JMAK1]|nr:ABC transporter substrate-binding protein [Bacillaceae bacterium JMAK1]